MLVVHGPSYVKKFAEKTGGFIVMRHHLQRWWKIPAIWLACFAILFGQDIAVIDFERPFTHFSLVESFEVDGELKVDCPEVLPIIISMLRYGLKTAINGQHDPDPTLRKHGGANTSSNNKYASGPEQNDVTSAPSNTEPISTSMYLVLRLNIRVCL